MKIALAAFALAVAPQALAQDAAATDPAARPSVIAPLAAKSLLLDLAWAGPRVVAVGERGHVLHSVDAGRTWTQVQAPASANLTAVYFADAKNGWAVGHAQTILRTQDGGDTWVLSHFEPEEAEPFLDVSFGDGLRGLVVGAYGVIYSTTDGGSVWSHVPFEPAPLPGAAKVEPSADDMEAEVDLGFEFHLNALARGPGPAPVPRAPKRAGCSAPTTTARAGANCHPRTTDPFTGSCHSKARRCWPSGCAATCSAPRTAA